MKPAPEHRSNGGENPCKTMIPAADKRRISQQQVDQKSSPDLPLNSIAAVTEKGIELEYLFDLFKKCLDAPAAFIQITNTAGGPLRVGVAVFFMAILSCSFG